MKPQSIEEFEIKTNEPTIMNGELVAWVEEEEDGNILFNYRANNHDGLAHDGLQGIDLQYCFDNADSIEEVKKNIVDSLEQWYWDDDQDISFEIKKKT